MAVTWDGQKDSWGPQPTVGPAAIYLELQAAPVSPHVSFCVFWDGTPASLESWRRVRPSPKLSCVSWFIKSTTQGVTRKAGLGIFM